MVEAVCGRPLVSEATGDDKEQVIMGGKRFEIIGPSRSFDFNSKSWDSWLETFSVEVETTLMCHYIGLLLAVLEKAQYNVLRGDVPEDPQEAVISLQAAALQYNEPSLPKFLPSRALGAVSRDVNEVLAEPFIDKYVTSTGLLAAYPGLYARIDLAELLSSQVRPPYYNRIQHFFF